MELLQPLLWTTHTEFIMVLMASGRHPKDLIYNTRLVEYANQPPASYRGGSSALPALLVSLPLVQGDQVNEWVSEVRDIANVNPWLDKDDHTL